MELQARAAAPPQQRTKPKSKLAKRVADDFMHTAKTYTLRNDDESESEEPKQKYQKRNRLSLPPPVPLAAAAAASRSPLTPPLTQAALPLA